MVASCINREVDFLVNPINVAFWFIFLGLLHTCVYTPPPPSKYLPTTSNAHTTQRHGTLKLYSSPLSVWCLHTHTHRVTHTTHIQGHSNYTPPLFLCDVRAHTHTHTLSLLNTHILHALIHYSFSCLDTQVLKQVYLPLIKVKQSQYMYHIKLYKTNNADILYKVTLFCCTCIRQDVINTQHQEQKGLRSTLSNGYLL